MAVQRYGAGARGTNLLGSIVVGDGGMTVKKIVAGTFTADTSSVALSAVETTTFTLSGATTGDLVFLFPSTALNAGLTLVGNANVTATSQVTVSFVNETTAAIVQTSGLVNRYVLLKV